MADSKVLVLEQDPDLHLPLVEIVAHFVKVVIQDVLQIVWLDSQDLGQDFLACLLFFLIITYHKIHLSLEDFAEEIAAQLTHFPHMNDLTFPIINEPRILFHLIFQNHLATDVYEEFFEHFCSFLLLQVLCHHVVER